MSKEVNFKNQNKLKVYLEKSKKNDIKSDSKRTDQAGKRSRAN
jgi:hypothetical protein